MIGNEPGTGIERNPRGCRGHCGCSGHAEDVPGVPDFPDVPGIPDVPDVPSIPAIPGVPEIPDVPSAPDVPAAPGVPQGAASAERPDCACKGIRPYRRMHSLAGLAFALFIGVHFMTGASALSPHAFQVNANLLRSLAAQVPGIELIAVALPLLALIALGGRLLIEAGLSPARKRCDRGGKVRYFLQRISALVILSFVLYHVATLSGWGIGGGLFDPERPFDSVVAAVRANAAVSAFYLLAIVAVSYHLANGLWTGAIGWGVVTTERAKRTWELACLAFGIALCSTGVAAWYAFVVATGYV
jgi:succinate dehydrogenase / fumarate reductase cytochrome b subunit